MQLLEPPLSVKTIMSLKAMRKPCFQMDEETGVTGASRERSCDCAQNGKLLFDIYKRRMLVTLCSSSRVTDPQSRTEVKKGILLSYHHMAGH